MGHYKGPLNTELSPEIFPEGPRSRTPTQQARWARRGKEAHLHLAAVGEGAAEKLGLYIPENSFVLNCSYGGHEHNGCE